MWESIVVLKNLYTQYPVYRVYQKGLTLRNVLQAYAHATLRKSFGSYM